MRTLLASGCRAWPIQRSQLRAHAGIGQWLRVAILIASSCPGMIRMSNRPVTGTPVQGLVLPELKRAGSERPSAPPWYK